MKRTLPTFAALFLLPLLGCSSVSPRDGKAADAKDSDVSDAGKQRKIEGLERELAVARERLELSRLEQAVFSKQHEPKVRQASMEIEIAQARLARFREADKHNKLASAQLDLRTAKDRAQEAVDELAQIEIMYKEQDLDDLTAEFVVGRGRRAAERAAKRIEIQEGMLAALEQELAQEEKGYELAVDKATSALSKLEAEAETGMKGKAISVQEAGNEVARLEGELTAAREKEPS